MPTSIILLNHKILLRIKLTERLKYGLSGRWSRRINSEHRIIYKINDDKIEILVLSMRYHYTKKN
jgi:Txe/YoeB family toxin of toxin-antitoxin system